MKRMGVFIFFDGQGIVDKYVEVLLDSMQEILQKLVIVINGEINEKGYNKLKSYSHDIYRRENVGFDAGAYKDVFTRFVPKKDLKQWDEIVLFNDTFYGPLYPWDEIFGEMEDVDIDFWGLSRYLGKYTDDRDTPSHVQSFFLVCRKSLIMSALWGKFWRCLEYPRSLEEAISNFEIGFSEFFTQNGFRSKTLTDNGVKYIGNPYIHYPYELIRDVKFPIIKRKSVSLGCFRSVKLIVNYAKFDYNLIFSHVKRLQKEGRHNMFYPFKKEDIEYFYNVHKRIYIYGHGNYGQGMAVYFDYKGWKYEGFLVTKKNENEEKDNNVFTYNNTMFHKEDGIILALGKRAFIEVYPMIKSKLNMEQLLLPQIK